jgi:hypothetical protein
MVYRTEKKSGHNILRLAMDSFGEVSYIAPEFSNAEKELNRFVQNFFESHNALVGF